MLQVTSSSGLSAIADDFGDFGSAGQGLPAQSSSTDFTGFGGGASSSSPPVDRKVLPGLPSYSSTHHCTVVA